MNDMYSEIKEKNKKYLLNLIYDLFDIKINDSDLIQNLLGEKFPINISEVVILLDRIEKDRKCAIYEFLQEHDYSILTLENILARLNDKATT